MMAKLELIRGTVVLLDYQGDSLGIVLFYESDQSLSQTIEPNFEDHKRREDYSVSRDPADRTSEPLY